VCARCSEKTALHDSCKYIPGNSTLASFSHQPDTVGVASSPPPATCPIPILDLPVDPEPDSQIVPDESNQVGFVSKVSAAIDKRLGLPVARDRSPIPMTDAPLFGGALSLPPRHRDHHLDNVLPPRKEADRLVNLFFQHLEPLEPIFDRQHFDHSYRQLFDGQELDGDEGAFVCLLNAIFALSTETQELVPAEQRAEASRTFFRRAWALLQPERALWEPGSMTIVQCLLLVARYLQCTSTLHATWMAVGTAVRMAQGLGLHLRQDSAIAADKPKLAGQIWQCCVSMDR
jgi:hypothetical protein